MSEARLPEPGPGRFSGLGTGGRDDRLGFREVVHILWRALPLMRPVRGHLFALGGLVLSGVLVGLPITLLMTDILTTRVLEGRPLTPVEARVLALDPAVYASNDADATVEEDEEPRLAPELRRTVRDRWAVVFGVLFVLATPFFAALIYYGLWILQRINQVLRVQLLERIQALSLRFHADSRVGDSIYRLFQDSAMVTSVIETLFLRPLQFGALHAIGLAVVAGLDPWLALAILLVWPPMLGVGVYFSGRLRRGFRQAREANSALTSRIQETLAGIRLIKAYGAEDFEQARFEADSLAAFDAAFSARSRYALYGITTFWIAGTAVIVGLVYAALRANAGAPLFAIGVFSFLGFSVWNYGLFSFLRQRFGQATSSVEQIMSWWGRAQDIAIGLDRVYELLDLEPEVRDAPGAQAFPPLGSGIAFRDVSFAYEPGRPVLRKVSLAAAPGTITAIVGPTGSGKSTLMMLLLRLFEPDEGVIEIGGVDVRKIRVAELRHAIAIALQENLLFGTTVRENIRYAVPDASDADVREAARVAAADEFIEELPQGYDTLLGERGTKLSTGQRQRLSIARAVLKRAPVLVLDEPTASLDAATELRVLANLAEWGRERAIFLITHRLSTIRRADRIVVLGSGSVVETGTHAELVARLDGSYGTLVATEEEGLAAGSPP